MQKIFHPTVLSSCAVGHPQSDNLLSIYIAILIEFVLRIGFIPIADSSRSRGADQIRHFDALHDHRDYID